MIYISLEGQISPHKTKSFLTKHNVTRWVYLGENTSGRILIEKKFFPQISRISIADELHSVSRKYRQAYIDWIGECSQKSNSPEWWASEIPAKDPYSHLYLRICFFAIGKKLIAVNDNDHFLIICSSPVLVKELVNFAQSNNKTIEQISPSQSTTIIDRISNKVSNWITGIGKELPLVGFIRIFSPQYYNYLEEHPIYRHQILKGMQVFPQVKFAIPDKTILFFTYVDNRNFTDDGKYQDPHFGSLSDNLKKRGYDIFYIPRILPTIRYMNAMKKLNLTGEKFIFLEQFIDKHDLKNSQQKAADFVPDLDKKIQFLDIPMNNFIEENLIETRQTFASNILLSKSILNMANAGLIPGKIMYTCEGQSWESSLIAATRQSMPETKIVAYDNVTFSKMMLSMFPSKTEHNIRPFPDILITNGPLYRDILVKGGYPPERIRVGCALRHAYLWDKITTEQKNDANKTGYKRLNLLVASAISHGDSVDMITKISNAFGGDTRFDIRIKCHPLINFEDLKKSLVNMECHPNITFTNEPIRILLKSADILFYTYTSVCFEALQFNVFPVCVHLENFLNIDKLDIAPDVRWTATTQQDLKNVVSEITHMPIDQRRIWEEKASHVVKDALLPIGSDCFDSFIA